MKYFLPLILAFAWASVAAADDSSRARALFADPPSEYASAPLWTWNDLLTEEQIRSTMQDLAGQKVMQVFVHPRPGLMTPYLSDDWFRLWKVALDEAERLDMNVWIYDENSYPSGFAGGLVPEAMPESRGKGVSIDEVHGPPTLGDDTLAVFRPTENGYENVTERLRSGAAMPEGKYLVASIRLAPIGGWFGGKYYVDLLKPGVTEKFLEVTMGPYERELGEHFGKRIPGVFTDEPHLAPAGGLHWSDHLPELFQERFGYDLIDSLPSLTRPVGDWKKVRHNYYQLLLEQFIERWAKPCYEYCKDHNLEFTGHYWEHGWPDAGHGGDNMAMYAWHHRPAIDTLMNKYDEGVNAQFGNVRAVIELASAANQMGRRRTLCEAYGAGGWDLRFEDMKRIGDWLYVLGVNTMDEHLSYVTIRGARKRDHPQSFSYHEPWWDSYHVMAEYFTRLSLVMSEGQQINEILVIEPTTTAWMYQRDPKMRQIGDTFQSLVTTLAKRQVEFDLGCEDIIARNGQVVDSKLLRVGQRDYRVVVLPPDTENLNATTMDLLEKLASQGGRILCCGPPPTHVDGQPSDRGAKLATSSGFEQIEPNLLPAVLLEQFNDSLIVRQNENDQGILFHHRRRLDDGDLLLLVNTSIDSPTSGVIESSARGVERWDPQTGRIDPFPFTTDTPGTKASFKLPPCGSLVLFLSNEAKRPPVRRLRARTTLAAAGPVEIGREGPNVLTLDYVDITAGGETRENVYFYAGNSFAFEQNGMDGDPWDRAVQFRDELITKKFPTGSGFEATYRFTLEEKVPEPLHIVIERPDLYAVTCNAQTVTAPEGDWWLDKSFGRIDISSVAKVGENRVTIKATPMTVWHELEPAYLLGDFTLKATESGFVVQPDRPLELIRDLAHDNAVEGHAWLSAGVGYQRDLDSDENDRKPFVVFDLGKVRSLAGVKVWNYNEVNIPQRGAKGVKLSGSKDGSPDSFTIPMGTFELDPADGIAGRGQLLDASVSGVRFVRFDMLSNHSGVNFPADQEPAGNAFVGLGEVRFLAETREIDGVTIHDVSSELTWNSHDRRAVHLVDGSGLESTGLGWNRQGHPFHGGGVRYTEKFQVAQVAGTFRVELGQWRGSVARVTVNGKPAGVIAYQPWSVDVSEYITSGENTIDVIVVGTLRNTLGPHHAGPMVGSAWPHAFQQGPSTGPPPGAAYHTLDYGLFEPFTLRQSR